MQQIRRAQERGRARFSWLNSYHTFSFGHYFDPAHMGISALRVINEDHVIPGGGFATHPHRNMEILSYVLAGQIEHKDSMGHIQRLPAGEFQLMSAGSGVTHSEYNPSACEPLTFLQIWIEPNEHNTPPAYQQKRFEGDRPLTLVASPDGAEGSLRLRQDARIYHLKLPSQGQQRLELFGRNGYLQLIRGALSVGDISLQPGDGLSLRDEAHLDLTAQEEIEALVFDLPDDSPNYR